MLTTPTTSHATALFEASQNGQRIGALSAAEPAMDMTDAYTIQREATAMKRDAGIAQMGWKIGFSAKPVMAMLGVEAPVCGVLTDDRIFDAGATLPTGRLNAPRLEAEIAFVMATDLQGPECTRADVVAATAYVSPAIELVDGRYLPQDPKTGAAPKAVDMVADNVAFGGLILGSQQHKVEDVDLTRVGVVTSVNGEVEETGMGASVYGDPLDAMAWLVNHLATSGEGLKAGQTVLSGSLVRHFPCPAGSYCVADFGDFGLVDFRVA